MPCDPLAFLYPYNFGILDRPDADFFSWQQGTIYAFSHESKIDSQRGWTEKPDTFVHAIP